MQQFHAAFQVGRELVARFVQHFGSHPHGGQRGTQFVADVGDELALDS